MLRLFITLAIISTFIFSLSATATAETVNVRFWSQGQLVLVQRDVPMGTPPADAAVRAAVAGPTQIESSFGMYSMIPAGVTLKSLAINSGLAEIDFSPEVLTKLDEYALSQIFEQIKATLGDFPDILSIRLTCNNELLSSYLAPAPDIGEPPAKSYSASGVGLSGKKICVGPSHGMVWKGWWGVQRSDPCGYGDAVLEDYNSIRLVQFLKQYLVQDGAIFSTPRQLDESDCCNSSTGLPWWKMCAQSWLHHAGVSCSIWASSSGNCGSDTAVDRQSDDIRARPLYADSKAADIYIAHHTNAGGGGTATGTITYRDTAMEHPAHETNSYNLASAVQSSIVSTIRNTFPEEPNWYNRGVGDSSGGFGEIRIPNRPAILIELAFHDDCTRDANYLRDDFFRSLCEWAVYSGICTYFGNTPTWGKYSDEYVSDTIPVTMNPGQSYPVSVTMRNRGVCWQVSRGFRLGAVGDSDPFTTFNRVDVSGTIKPGSTYTFNFTMKAPSTPGTYTSDWRMVRDGYTWFGATVSKSIVVGSVVDNQPPTVPQNVRRAAATPNSITVAWDASTDNVGVAGYRIYRDGLEIGTSATTSFVDSSRAPNTAYVYEVDAYDAKPNYSAKSVPVSLATGATWTRSNARYNCYVRSGTPDVCGGGGIAVGYSTTSTLLIRRGLVQWDMTGAPTQNEVIDAPNSVRIKLYQYLSYSPTTSADISLYKVNNDWNETNGTWNNVGLGSIYTGATVTCTDVGDRTWAYNGHALGVPPHNRGVYVKNDTSESIPGPAKIFDNRTNVGGSGTPPRLEIDYVDLTAPSSCSVTIDGGAAYTVDPNVILTLYASDTLSGVTKMQFSEDGVSYSEPEAFATTKDYPLSAEDGVKTVYVKFGDAVGNWSAPVSDTITLDAAGPTVMSVNVSPPRVPAGYPVTVTVIVTDQSGVSGVNALGETLSHGIGDTWTGTVTALPGVGAHEVTVTATDTTGKQTINTECTYTTNKVFAMANGSLLPLSPTQWLAPDYLYKVWGTVVLYGSDHFTVDDGSNNVVYCYCPGYSLTAGQRVSVIGIYNCLENPPELETVPSQIQPH